MYQYVTRVGVSQTNRYGELALRPMLDLAIDCAYFQLPTITDFAEFLRRNNLGMFVIFRQVDILRRPRHGEKLRVATSIFDCRSAIGYRNTVIRDEAGEFCVKEYSLGAFVDFVTGKPARLTPEVRAMLNFDEKLDMEYTSRKIAMPESEVWQAVFERKITENFLDLNRHMNSNWFVTFAEECLPENFSYNRMRIEYRQQGKPGEVVQVQSAAADGKIWVRESSAAGEVMVDLEFSTF